MFQVAQQTVHDIDADSAIWTRSSIITDDRSSCRFSDEEVSECVYVYHEYMCIIRKVCNCAQMQITVFWSSHMQIIFVLWSLQRVLQ